MPTAAALPPTPFLALDEAVLRRNIAAMQARADAAGADLRPHVKTHKIAQIARLQLEAGARGITVATLAEAEAFVAAGFDDVFIAYPLWVDAARGARLAELARRARIAVGCDSAASARELARNLGVDGAVGGSPLVVLVEVDSGMHRTGVDLRGAGEVALAAREAGLDVAGVFTFPGHSYAPGEGRRVAAEQERATLTQAADALAQAGVPPRIVSGGSSPSAEFATAGSLTELRPGVYVTQDAQQWELGACGPQDIALTAYAGVVSHAGGRVVLDSGSKTLGADRAGYASGYGRLLDHPDARIVMLSEHHAVVETGSDELPPLGSVLRVVPNHACNAFNLADEVVLVEQGRAPGSGPAERATAAWSLIARNANT